MTNIIILQLNFICSCQYFWEYSEHSKEYSWKYLQKHVHIHPFFCFCTLIPFSFGITMDEQFDEKATFTAVLIISILSLIGDGYVVISYIPQICNREKRRLIKSYVWCMAFAGVFIDIKIAVESIQVIISNYWTATMSRRLCGFFGLLTQGLYAFYHLINVIIALGLLIPTMNGTPIDQLSGRRTRFYKICICIVVSIQVLLPLGVYGSSDVGTNNNELQAIQCWIKSDKPGWYLTLYIPEAFYVFCYACTFIWCLYKRVRICCNGTDNYMDSNVKQLLWYMAFYFIYTIVPVYVRLSNVRDPNTPGINIVGLFNILISCIGVCNAIVWKCYFHDNIHAYMPT